MARYQTSTNPRAASRAFALLLAGVATLSAHAGIAQSIPAPTVFDTGSFPVLPGTDRVAGISPSGALYVRMQLAQGTADDPPILFRSAAGELTWLDIHTDWGKFVPQTIGPDDTVYGSITVSSEVQSAMAWSRTAGYQLVGQPAGCSKCSFLKATKSGTLMLGSVVGEGSYFVGADGSVNRYRCDDGTDSDCFALSISDDGTAIGGDFRREGEIKLLVWDTPTSVPRAIPFPAGYEFASVGMPMVLINDAGTILANVRPTGSTTGRNIALWTNGGSYRALLPNAYATGLSNDGLASVNVDIPNSARAMIWNTKTNRSILLPGLEAKVTASLAFDINADRTVVGVVEDESGRYHVTWQVPAL